MKGINPECHISGCTEDGVIPHIMSRNPNKPCKKLVCLEHHKQLLEAEKTSRWLFNQADHAFFINNPVEYNLSRKNKSRASTEVFQLVR